MKVEILDRDTDSVLYSGEHKSVREALEHAVKGDIDLSRAELAGADLSEANLQGARLSDADLSDAQMYRANLIGADLAGALLQGTELCDSDLTSANLSRADLDNARLYNAVLRAASLREAWFREADLTNADLRDADLLGASLRGANLTGATANSIRPENFGLAADEGLMWRVAERIVSSDEALVMANWHTCETQHCLAGWAVHLSGPGGYALEQVTSPSVAGCLLIPDMAHLFFETERPQRVRDFCREVLSRRPPPTPRIGP